MTISRVVKRSLLNQWVESKAAKTYTNKETVDAIMHAVYLHSVELSYETQTPEYVFVRIEQTVKDKLRDMPWAVSGGSLTNASPKTQIGLMRYNSLKSMPHIKERDVVYHDPTVTIDDNGNYITLTINTSCEA
ncbi:hypothetical protein PHABIO_323 [Pseudomonas phage Phabio]|uniref:Uncharacterized protein n=1 Tax=Pseudomonas phage Phabio TaxID=2006668 RepID=A0A1Y0SWJ6_9CAUD|nr:hypothetical protein MZD05_gp323 [Pseudomonas phage Phabio]ARV76954.1 hypothetical protein PHABIO_323 [Pseudomonas phage Phabio]